MGLHCPWTTRSEDSVGGFCVGARSANVLLSGTMPEMCPRCAHTEVEHLASAPDPGVWEVFGCARCNYTWRSTEPEENTNPDKYPAVFRLSPEKLAKLEVAPTIPPLRSKKP